MYHTRSSPFSFPNTNSSLSDAHDLEHTRYLVLERAPTTSPLVNLSNAPLVPSKSAANWAVSEKAIRVDYKQLVAEKQQQQQLRASRDLPNPPRDARNIENRGDEPDLIIEMRRSASEQTMVNTVDHMVDDLEQWKQGERVRAEQERTEERVAKGSSSRGHSRIRSFFKSSNSSSSKSTSTLPKSASTTAALSSPDAVIAATPPSAARLRKSHLHSASTPNIAQLASPPAPSPTPLPTSTSHTTLMPRRTLTRRPSGSRHRSRPSAPVASLPPPPPPPSAAPSSTMHRSKSSWFSTVRASPSTTSLHQTPATEPPTNERPVSIASSTTTSPSSYRTAPSSPVLTRTDSRQPRPETPTRRPSTSASATTAMRKKSSIPDLALKAKRSLAGKRESSSMDISDEELFSWRKGKGEKFGRGEDSLMESELMEVLSAAGSPRIGSPRVSESAVEKEDVLVIERSPSRQSMNPPPRPVFDTAIFDPTHAPAPPPSPPAPAPRVRERTLTPPPVPPLPSDGDLLELDNSARAASLFLEQEARPSTSRPSTSLSHSSSSPSFRRPSRFSPPTFSTANNNDTFFTTPLGPPPRRPSFSPSLSNTSLRGSRATPPPTPPLPSSTAIARGTKGGRVISHEAWHQVSLSANLSRRASGSSSGRRRMKSNEESQPVKEQEMLMTPPPSPPTILNFESVVEAGKDGLGIVQA